MGQLALPPKCAKDAAAYARPVHVRESVEASYPMLTVLCPRWQPSPLLLPMLGLLERLTQR